MTGKMTFRLFNIKAHAQNAICTTSSIELAHGSNVAGVETTATFDEKTDEFVIHTPHLGATKWWIGGKRRKLPPPESI